MQRQTPWEWAFLAVKTRLREYYTQPDDLRAGLPGKVFWELFGNIPYDKVKCKRPIRIFGNRKCCQVAGDGPGSRDQGAGARQTEQHSSTATGHEEGVDEELESRHARGEGGCEGPGLSLARSRPSPDGRYRGQVCEWVCPEVEHLIGLRSVATTRPADT